MFDNLHEECGVFGIYDAKGDGVAMKTYLALYALQHRGQESCGISINDDGLITTHKGQGLVPEVFTKDTLEHLKHGQCAIGHVRYSTTGLSSVVNAQPLMVRHVKGPMAIVHNGNLVNSHELREQYEMNGAIFHTSSDTEVIAYTITAERIKSKSIEQAIEQAMYHIKGAYSLVIMSPKKLIAVRDPNGFRPLCMGELDGSIIFASETCALDSIGAKFVREVKPGEIIVVNKEGIRSITTHCGGKNNLCVFEYVYFARPDSIIEGASVHQARMNAGKYLAQQHPVDADVVIGVPDSGLDAALGYSKESGIPYGVGFIKNRYIGRTFIQPEQSQREASVRIKLNAVSATVKDKRVILIDDSIVRGTTSARIVNLLRQAGAKEVHMRISSPPFTNPCYFGTDIDSKDKLIACRMSIPEIAKQIGVDSLGYLSVENLVKIPEGANCDFCVGCFTGKYPIEVPTCMPKNKFDYKISDNIK